MAGCHTFTVVPHLPALATFPSTHPCRVCPGQDTREGVAMRPLPAAPTVRPACPGRHCHRGQAPDGEARATGEMSPAPSPEGRSDRETTARDRCWVCRLSRGGRGRLIKIDIKMHFLVFNYYWRDRKEKVVTPNAV